MNYEYENACRTGFRNLSIDLYGAITRQLVCGAI